MFGDRRDWRRLAFIVAAIAVLYGRTLWFGFDWDDYHLAHTYSGAEVRAAAIGVWSPVGIEAPFYRPLTILFFAIRSWTIGSNPLWLHACGLVMFVCAAALFDRFARTFSLREPARVAGALAFVAHPLMARSAVVWITSQMHLLLLLLALFALLQWTRRRDGTRSWWPILVTCSLAMLVKEDGVMLGPALIALQVADRTVAGPGSRWPPRAFLAGLVVVTLGYLILRTYALGGLGGYSPGPSALRMAWNLAKGPIAMALLWPDPIRLVSLTQNWPGWLMVSAAAVSAGVFVGTTGAARRAAVCGLVLIVTFNWPYALVSGPYQYELLVLGTALAFAGAVEVTVSRLRGAGRWVMVTLFAAVLAGMATVSMRVVRQASPCSGETRAHDARVRDWDDAVPLEMRQRLADKHCPD